MPSGTVTTASDPADLPTRAANGDALSPAVNLADSEPVRIGPLLVEPARRRVSHCDGRSATVEPRAMKLLVAMLRAPGAVFSRDALFEACWEGRAVSDDAVDQAVGRLRRALAPVVDEIVRLETVPKVGHRLVLKLPKEAEEPTPVPSGYARHRAVAQRAWWIAGVAMIVLLIAAVGYMWASAQPSIPRVAVVGEQGPGAEQLSREVTNDLARLANARTGEFAIVESGGTRPDYLLRIATVRAGDMVRAEVGLASSGTSELLWSTAFERPFREAADLRREVAARVGATLLCAMQGASSPGAPKRDQLKLFLAACDSDTPGPEKLELLRRLTEATPGFAPGWAQLALIEAQLGFAAAYSRGLEDNAQKRALRAAARDHLLRARRLDPQLGATYVAEAELLEDGEWAERMAIYERGLAVDPDHPLLHRLGAQALDSVGRMEEAVQSARRAAELGPLSEEARSALIFALAYSGRTDEARRHLAEAERIWPRSAVIGEVRSSFSLRYGDPAVALREWGRHYPLNEPAAESLDGLRAYLRARVEPSPANVDAALARLRGQQLQWQALAQFGRVDEWYNSMFRFLQTPRGPEIARQVTAVVFRDYQQPIRRDRRFIEMMARIGLLQYWRASGVWPDFCRERDLPYDCRAEADRLLGPG